MTDDDIERERLIDAVIDRARARVMEEPERTRRTVLPFVNHRAVAIPADAWETMKAIGRAAFGIRYDDDREKG